MDKINKRKYNKESYDYYKSHKICVHCHREDAEPNHTCCYECKNKMNNSQREHYKHIKSVPELIKKYRDKRSESYKNYVSSGKCGLCGKTNNGVRKSNHICIECSLKQRRYKADKRKGVIPRSERAAYGMCFFCGEPVKEGYKTCIKHYEDICFRLKKLNANPTPAMLKAREQFRKEENRRVKKWKN